MLKWFKAEDTIDSIVSDFTAKVGRLKALASKHLSDAANKRDDATKLIDEAAEHETNAARADKIASKINNLLVD